MNNINITLFNKKKAYVYNNILKLTPTYNHKPRIFIVILVKPYCKRFNFS